MNDWTGPLPELSEDKKTFVDDLYDSQIINLAKIYVQPMVIGTILTNRHLNYLEFSYHEMQQVKVYCQYLIALGAVKSAIPVEASE